MAELVLAALWPRLRAPVAASGLGEISTCSGLTMKTSRAGGSGEINYRNCECDDGDGNRFLELIFEAHGDRSFPGENSFDSFFRLTGFGHRNALPPDASGSGLQGFEKFQQDSWRNACGRRRTDKAASSLACSARLAR